MKRTDITELFPEATDEQIKALMDINGADINNAKKGVEDLKTQLSTAQGTIAELQKASTGGDLQNALDRAAALETELSGLKMANQLRELRETVAKSAGVPADLLTGDTEDACKSQAEAILAFAKQQGAYPALRDAGEVQSAGTANRDKFAAWFQENL